MLEEQNRRLIEREISAALDGDNPFRAHLAAFAALNKFPSPDFHPEIAADLHGPHPRTVDEAFRGGAKSTLAEQAISLRGAFGRFRYGLILAETYGKAAQRLASIKTILATNPTLRRIFGELRGPVWNEAKITLANGTTLEAIGARQSIRGFKEGDQRPDFLLIDDLETDEWVKTPEAIEANRQWLFREIIPALDDPERTPIRMIGTPLAKNSLLRQLANSDEWRSRRFPVRYPHPETGDMVSAWPAKFSLETVAKIEANYLDSGAHRAFVQEYMCESESDIEQVFTPEMLTAEPKVRTWQSVYAMIDPARTTNKTSAQTGWAVWSWHGSDLSVWECGGAYLQPSEVVDLAFRIFQQYRPVEIGVEADGLEQWLMQPIRDAQVRSGVIPVTALRAPRGKIDFIKGLQPFFKDRRARFCMEEGDPADKFKNATAQFLSFPRGVIDAPNALAYATTLRPGLPVYQDFSRDSIEVGAAPISGRACVLALNADGSRVTGLLVQEQGGVSHVLGEWIEEGQPVDVVRGIVREAGIMSPGHLTVCIGPDHVNNRHSNRGLNQALHRLNVNARVGGDTARGRSELQEMLRRRARGRPGLVVADTCRFTLNAFACGFAYPVQFNVVGKEPAPGIYRTLMEGLEGFIASAMLADPEDEIGNFQTTADGRRYRSAYLRK